MLYNILSKISIFFQIYLLLSFFFNLKKKNKKKSTVFGPDTSPARAQPAQSDYGPKPALEPGPSLDSRPGPCG